MSGGTTVILVSHSDDDIKKICRHGIWIDKGVMQYVGDSNTVLEKYHK